MTITARSCDSDGVAVIFIFAFLFDGSHDILECNVFDIKVVRSGEPCLIFNQHSFNDRPFSNQRQISVTKEI